MRRGHLTGTNNAGSSYPLQFELPTSLCIASIAPSTYGTFGERETRIAILHARYEGEKGVQTKRRDKKPQKKRRSEAMIDDDDSGRSLDAKTPFFRCLSSPLVAFSCAPDQIGRLVLFGFLGFSGLLCRFFPFLTCSSASPRIFRVSTLPLVSLFWSS